MTAAPIPPNAAPPPSGGKLLIELAPLVLFFGVYATYGIKPATGVLMVSTLASLAAAKFWLGHVTPMLIVTAVLVCFFGLLTFLLDDPSFIKMKPTAVNLLFAGVLGYGLASGRYFMKTVLGEALQMTDEGWHKLTVRWIGFFLVLAGLNEVIWRTMSEADWVKFKVFGILPLTIAFTLAQVRLMTRYAAPKSPVE
jgi:intracellular septation protein